MANESCRLTTFDNPHNPFTEFDKWLLFDKERGYDSINVLARVARTSEEMTDEEYDLENERAIDKIIKYDPLNVYRKVRRSMKKM